MSELTQALAPKKMRQWHEHVADLWIENPLLTQREIAKLCDKTEAWVSIVVNCDAFREYLHARKEEIVDPVLRATVEDRFRAVVNAAAEKLLDRITLASGSMSNKDLIDAMDKGAKALGMGPQAKAPVLQQNLFVLPNPNKPRTTEEWMQVVENQAGGQG